MTQISGYSTSLPTNVLLGPAVLYIDSATAWAVSQGGIRINLPREYENLPFDGKLIDIAGLDRRMGGVPSFEGTFVEMTAARALELEPAGASATASSIVTVTPGLYGEFLATGDYKENVRVAMRMGASASGIIVVEFNFGLLMCEEIASDGSSKNGTYRVKFEARQAANAASLGVAPYTIKQAASMAVIASVDP